MRWIRRKWVRRIGYGLVLVTAAALIWTTGGGYVAPDPDECKALAGRPEAAYAAETMGCPDVDFRDARP